jgi:hypothetical protein
MERARGARCPTVCLSMYSITENIYYSQLSSVPILLQPETVSHRIVQGKTGVLSPYVLSSCGLSLPPTCLLLMVNEARSYFASSILSHPSRTRKMFVQPATFRLQLLVAITLLLSNSIVPEEVSRVYVALSYFSLYYLF